MANKRRIRQRIKSLAAEGKEIPDRLKSRAEAAGVNYDKVYMKNQTTGGGGQIVGEDGGGVIGRPVGNPEKKEHLKSSPIKGYNIDRTKGLINSQNEANMDAEQRQAEWNRVNEQDMYGGSQYTQNPDGTWTRTTSLNQGQQNIHDNRTNFSSSLGNMANQFAQNANLTNPFSYDGQAQRQNMMNQQMDFFDSRNNQRFAKENENLEQRLASMGISRGSEKWNQEMNNLSQRQGDQRQSAMNSAMNNAGQEMTRDFNMAATTHQMPLAQLGQMSNLMGYAQGPNVSGISQVGVNPLNVAGIWQGNKGLDLTARGQDLQHSASMAAINKPHAGMGYDPFALATHKANLDRENALIQAELNNPGSTQGVSTGDAFAGGFGAGVGAGVGQAL